MFRSGAGERIGGYRVVRRLATGGTSDVLLAKAEGPHGFERTVVLKLLLAQYQDDPEAMAMFAREASAYARLSHPSIVQLYDFFALDGQLVMVLEYVDGPALHRLRGMLRTVGQHVEDRGALYLATRIFSALAAAHAARDESNNLAPVIHRDVNPSNILLPWDGQVKIADFGVAKVSGTAHQSSVGVLKGTYGYMAPEQITGEPVTPATDVYAGAIVLWELLTKRRAFQRGALPEVEALRQMSEPRIPALDTIRPDLPRGLRDLVRRALTPDVRKRDVTAEEAVSVLRSLVSMDEGRESLAASLAAVRHEPRPQMTSAPPPEDETQKVPFASPRGAGASPPPAAGVPAVSAKPPPPVPPRAPPPAPTPSPSPGRLSSGSGVVTSAPPIPRATAPGRSGEASVPPPVSSRTPPPPRPTLRKPSAPPMEEILPRSTRKMDLGKGTVSGLGPLAIPTPSNPGILRSAIDEVLRDVPSAIPADVFSSTSDAGADPTSDRDLGGLPPAPAPLVSIRSPSQPLSFPSLEHTVAMERRPGPVAAPPAAPTRAPEDVGDLPFPVRAAVPGSGPGPFGGLLGLVAGQPVTQPSPRVPSEPPVATMPMPPVGTNAAPLQRTLAMPSTPRGSEETSAPSPSPRPAHAATMLSAAPPPPPPRAGSYGPPADETMTSAGMVGGAAPPPPRDFLPATTSSAPVAASGASTSPPDRTSVTRSRPPRRRWPLAIMGLLVLAATGGVTWTERGRLAAQVNAVRRATGTAPAVPSATPTSASPASTATAIAPSSSASPPASVSPPSPASAATPDPTPTPIPTPTPDPTPAASLDAGTASTPATATAAAASASASARAPATRPTSDPAAATPPASGTGTTGMVKTAGSTPHRRIFVDEMTVGQTPDTVTVRCGMRSVRIGSSGKTHRVEVPCGGELTLTDR